MSDASSHEHDYRCWGECIRCHGAGACSMVGHGCVPCEGQCAASPLAITERMIDAFCETYEQGSGHRPQRMYVPLALEAALKASEALSYRGVSALDGSVSLNPEEAS